MTKVSGISNVPESLGENDWEQIVFLIIDFKMKKLYNIKEKMQSIEEFRLDLSTSIRIRKEKKKREFRTLRRDVV